MKIETFTSSQHWLETCLNERIAKNPSYSLRAFSKNVGLTVSHLSRVLSGQRKLTHQSLAKISVKLNLSPDVEQQLLRLITSEKSNQKKTKVRSELTWSSKQLAQETFSAISDWYHFGIMQLLNLDGFREDARWIASVLKITQLEAKNAIKRLLRLGILARDEQGVLFRTANSFATTDGVYSKALRKFHKQILERALESLENDDVLERHISSITVAIDESKLKEVNDEITKFKRKISRKLGSGKKTRIYNIGINIIPLSKSSLKEEK